MGIHCITFRAHRVFLQASNEDFSAYNQESRNNIFLHCFNNPVSVKGMFKIMGSTLADVEKKHSEIMQFY